MVLYKCNSGQTESYDDNADELLVQSFVIPHTETIPNCLVSSLYSPVHYFGYSVITQREIATNILVDNTKKAQNYGKFLRKLDLF